MMTPDLDIVIPVFNEGQHIVATMDAIRETLQGINARVLLCYDHDADDTLPVFAWYHAFPLGLAFVKNPGQGVLSAVRAGCAATTAPYVVVMPADDPESVVHLRLLLASARCRMDIVCPSRFMPGSGGLIGCPLGKLVLLKLYAWLLWRIARVPTHDASYGYRLFSRRVLMDIPLESTHGFAYSVEWLVKAHRRGWGVGEVPTTWHQRVHGSSRFHLLRWAPTYLRWLGYALATTYLVRPWHDLQTIYGFVSGQYRNDRTPIPKEESGKIRPLDLLLGLVVLFGGLCALAMLGAWVNR